MADIVSPSKRKEMMAGIRGKNTRPELLIRKALYARGYRYRLHAPELPGKPDITFPKFRATIFVNGCFWHGHDCHLFKLPATRADFWRKKIERTRVRDGEKKYALKASGWRVLVIWECAIRGKTSLDFVDVIDQIDHWLAAGTLGLEIRGGK